jgi:DNA polymerase III alpha subunit (gram-positive type)
MSSTLLDVSKILPGIKKGLSEPALAFYARHWDDRAHRFDGPLVFFDVETTGLDPNVEDIIEIGAISTSFDGVDVAVDAFWTLIDPGRQLPKKITEITGLTDADMKTGANPKDAYASFLDWTARVGPKRFVAHNSSFDERMLRCNLGRRGIDDSIVPEFLCTMKLSRKCLPRLENNKLQKVAEHYGIVNAKAHRAVTDAETTALCFFEMMGKNNAANYT